jgi:probable rRNA maturation factor
MKVEIHGTRDGRLLGDVRALARALERDFDPGAITVSVVFTDDRRIRTLNRDFRGRDRPTDVLSFNLPPAPAGDGIFGEIYVSRPTARRQARAIGHSLAAELRRLVLHGLFHLLGLSHRQMAPLYRRYLGEE